MLTLTGQLVTVFTTPKGQNSETGEVYGGQYKVQVLCQETLKNGEVRSSLETLTVSDPDSYKGKEGQDVTIPVRAFALHNGKSVPVRFASN